MSLKILAAAFVLLFLVDVTGNAQQLETQNIIVVTLDGLRWQEVFKGADARIVKQGKYVSDPQSIIEFTQGSSSAGNRQALMPFFWNTVAMKGQLYGNRHYKNKVNCTNHTLISYPGYSEMLVGFRHPKVASNDKRDNPHATVLEFIGNEEDFRDKVAAFATWDAFPYILRESTSAIYVNAGGDVAEGQLTRREHRLNELQQNGARTDSITFAYAMEYLKRERPRVILIGFDETDHYAHRGEYDRYLSAAHEADQRIARLWEWVQSQPDYRDNTTLFITTDHGRGNGKNNWRKHRLLAAGSRHIWFAVVGPDTPAFGEMRMKLRTYQNQVAKTLAGFLGLPYENARPVGKIIQTMIAVPRPIEPSSVYGSAKTAN